MGWEWCIRDRPPPPQSPLCPRTPPRRAPSSPPAATATAPPRCPAPPRMVTSSSVSAPHSLMRSSVSRPWPSRRVVAGPLPRVGPVAKLSETRATVRSAPPLLGEHTDEVLAEIGLPAHTHVQLESA